MPIKNLSEDVRLPRLGKIHLGKRHPEKGYPMKTDYFVFTEDHPDKERLIELYGNEPKELPILIPVEDEEIWATQYYKAYNQTYGLVCKGDGESATRMIDVKTKKIPEANKAGTVTMVDMECKGRDCPEYQSKKCHEVMNLRFILPEVPGLGVWQIDTGSKNSILNINSCAKLIKRAFGRISMIPLKLTFEPIQVNNPTDMKKQTVYVLNLRADITIAQLATVAKEQVKMLEIGASLEDAYDLEVEQDFALFDDNPPNINPPEEKPKKLKVSKKDTLDITKDYSTSTTDLLSPQIEDDAEEEQEPISEATESKSSESEPEKQGNGSETLDYEQIASFVKSHGQLKRACKKYFNLDEKEILAELNINSFDDMVITNAEAFLQIASVRN